MLPIRTRLRMNSVLLWSPVIIYYVFITLLSSLDLNHFKFQTENGLDKLYHFLEYGIVGALVYRALFWTDVYHHHLKKRGWLVAFFLIPLAAGADELHQFFVPSRQMDGFDWLADIFGVMAGFLVCFTIYRWRKKHSLLVLSTFESKN